MFFADFDLPAEVAGRLWCPQWALFTGGGSR